MNYIKCFSRSPVRAANNLQPVFFVPVPPCWHGWSITPRAICARPGASMLARMEYYAPCHLRPSWCPQAGTDGVLRPVYHLCPSRCLHAARMEYYARVPFAPVLVPPCWHGWSITPHAICARPGAPTPSYYIHYSISQKLGTLHRCPLLAAHYRLYRTSRRLGNCKQM